MAISTDAVIDFFGTTDTVTSSSSAVLDAAFSVVADVVTWTNDDDAVSASVVFSGTFSVAPTAGRALGLYASLQNINGTADQLDPSDAFAHVAVGTIPVKDVTTLQTIPLSIPLMNINTSQEVLFFIKNNAGQTLSSGWDLFVTPTALGPHA